MAPRPPSPPLPNPDNPHLVGAIEAMIAAMQQPNANMVNQHNLALQQMESARLAIEALGSLASDRRKLFNSRFFSSSTTMSVRVKFGEFPTVASISF